MEYSSLFYICNEEEIEICELQNNYVYMFRSMGFVFWDEKTQKHYVKNSKKLMKYCKEKNYISEYKVCFKRLREVVKDDL